jgi:microcystin-dependent protein
MSDAYLGEIRMFAGNYAPQGWAFCNGQVLPISQNTALFSLLGTTYGGNGTSNFALPNLQARFPLHAGQGPGLTPYSLGESTGDATVTLQTGQMPAHAHPLMSTASPTTGMPDNAVTLAPTATGQPIYHAATNTKPMAPAALAPGGGGGPHENRQAYLALNFIIAMQGIFPPRS